MMDKKMTLERLAEIVEAYGASPQRWPAAERRAAEALALSASAQALLEDARRLDAVLDTAPEGVASDMLVSRIMAARPRPVPAKPGRVVGGRNWLGALVQAIWPYGSPAFPAGALAASVALGIGFGLSSPVAVGALGLSSSSSAVASATTNAAGEQLVAFALAENEYPEEWK
jgi:hypothetical protein